MADIYLCGKGTGLIPLFEVNGKHIDCVSPVDCIEKYGRSLDSEGGCVQYKKAQVASSSGPKYQIAGARRVAPSTKEEAAKVMSRLRIPGREYTPQRGKDSGLIYSDDNKTQEEPTKAGLFGLPTYAVVGGVAVLGIAAFFVFSAKEKKG